MPDLPAIAQPTATPERPRSAAGRAAVRGSIKSYDGDRVCSDDGCSTVLSRYNGKDRCGVHQWEVQARV